MNAALELRTSSLLVEPAGGTGHVPGSWHARLKEQPTRLDLCQTGKLGCGLSRSVVWKMGASSLACTAGEEVPGGQR